MIIVKAVVKSIVELKSIPNTHDKWDLKTSFANKNLWSFKCAMDEGMATKTNSRFNQFIAQPIDTIVSWKLNQSNKWIELMFWPNTENNMDFDIFFSCPHIVRFFFQMRWNFFDSFVLAHRKTYRIESIDQFEVQNDSLLCKWSPKAWIQCRIGDRSRWTNNRNHSLYLDVFLSSSPLWLWCSFTDRLTNTNVSEDWGNG